MALKYGYLSCFKISKGKFELLKLVEYLLELSTSLKNVEKNNTCFISTLIQIMFCKFILAFPLENK